MASDDRIVSIHPTTHGFGFTVFESTTLIDWGHVHIRPADNDKALERIIELLSWYDPAVVVIEDTDCKGSRLCIPAESGPLIPVQSGPAIPVETGPAFRSNVGQHSGRK